jgi:hypothetical protein
VNKKLISTFQIKIKNMKQLDDFNEAQEALYDYFEFKEDWTAYPIDDRRKFYWHMNAQEVKFYDNKEAFETQDDMHAYTDEILHDRFYPKAVYEGADFTLIMVDTHTDGNKFLAIYDNSKKIK